MVFPVLSVIWHSPSECTTHGTPQNNTALASTPNPYLFWAHSSMWGTSHLEIAIWCDFCGAFSWCCFLLRFLNLLWDSFLLCGNLSFTTPFTKQVYFLKTFVILFVFILCRTSFQGDWLPSLDIWSPPPAFTSCSLGLKLKFIDLRVSPSFLIICFETWIWSNSVSHTREIQHHFQETTVPIIFWYHNYFAWSEFILELLTENFHKKEFTLSRHCSMTHLLLPFLGSSLLPVPWLPQGPSETLLPDEFLMDHHHFC